MDVLSPSSRLALNLLFQVEFEHGICYLFALTFTHEPLLIYCSVQLISLSCSCGKVDFLLAAATPSPPPVPLPPQSPIAPPPPPVCLADRIRAPNQGRRSTCSVYNDPHVRTFDQSFLICNEEGTMVLLDNEHFNITAFTVPVQSQAGIHRVSSQRSCCSVWCLGMGFEAWMHA